MSEFNNNNMMNTDNDDENDIFNTYERPYNSLNYQNNIMNNNLQFARPIGNKPHLDQLLGMSSHNIYENLKLIEHNHMIFDPTKNYIKERHLAVDWINDVGEVVGMHTTTIHVAQIYFDRLLHSIDIPKSQWGLIVICCLGIAAKMEEKEEDIPTIGHYERIWQQRISKGNILQCELFISTTLNWDLKVVTPLHFVEYYLAKGVLFEDDLWKNHSLIPSIPNYVSKYAFFFSGITQQDYCFYQFPPSLVASAIIYMTRRFLHLSPIWRKELVYLTQYNEEDIMDIVELIYGIFEAFYPEMINDSRKDKIRAREYQKENSNNNNNNDDDEISQTPLNGPAKKKHRSPKSVLDEIEVI